MDDGVDSHPTAGSTTGLERNTHIQAGRSIRHITERKTR
jgi:hypothetical protein